MIEDEATREFLVESHEGLDQLERDFVALEADPSQQQRIASIFRVVHTIKGTAGFLGFTRLEALSHAGESLLVLVRDGSQRVTPPIISALLALVDRVRASLKEIESSGRELPESNDILIARFESLRTGSDDSAHASPEAPSSGPVHEESTEVAEIIPPEADPLPEPSGQQPVTNGASSAQAASEGSPGPDPGSRKPTPATASTPASASAPTAANTLTTATAPAGAAQTTPVNTTATAAATVSAATAVGDTGSPAVTDSSVRVDVGLLERLMNLVGELVLARNQILQFADRIEESAFVGAAQRLNLITTELQERVMQTRMQAIGTVWSKLPRVIRDLAVACGKQVRVEMHGKETELDRTILEAIKDPLTHIVRNAVDHGIEAPAARAEKGKPRTGTLTMRAYHESGQVIVEITDDGRGLDTEAIKAKALERGVVGPERLEGMTQDELFQLVFLPGFSTARSVTNVSGRGVGMDVVKTNIERIGGTIDLASKAGEGTTIRVRIPLTLAIVPALLVVSGRQRFAIPQTNLLELVRLEGEAARTGIESVHGTPVHRLRGRLLPLVMLSNVVSGAPPIRHGDALYGREGASTLNIVVLQAGATQLGLVVDEVRDTEEIVVKPLGKELRGIALFAGATIMGDGRVALILDVAGLAQHVSSTSRGATENSRRKADSATSGQDGRQSEDALLLFEGESGGLTAVPVSRITRIEEFSRSRLERSGDNTVVQYRGAILPLIELAQLQATGGDEVTVLVITEGKKSIGILVQKIVDVVEERYSVEHCTSRPGVLGTVVVQGRVTELLDVNGLIGRKAPWFYREVAA